MTTIHLMDLGLEAALILLGPPEDAHPLRDALLRIGSITDIVVWPANVAGVVIEVDESRGLSSGELAQLEVLRSLGNAGATSLSPHAVGRCDVHVRRRVHHALAHYWQISTAARPAVAS